MASDVNHKIDVRNDGTVVLYRRQNRDGSINSVYQMRIRIPLPDSKGYFRGTTGESDVARAQQIALNKFDELYFKIKGGGSLNTKSFKDLFEEWADDYSSSANLKEAKYIDWNINRMRKYAFDYFVNVKGNPKVDELKISDFDGYWRFRKENSFYQNATQYVPSNNTLRKEHTQFKNILRFAHKRGYITDVINIERPKETSNRRPHFDKNEYRKLYTAMEQREKDSPTSVFRDRFFLRQYVLILANSGVRVGELRHLTWDKIRRQDYRDEVADEPDERVILQITHSKTAEREVVCQKGTERFFERIYDFRKEELKEYPSTNEYIFCHKDGRPIHSFRKSFDALLNDLGLKEDARGRKRSLYSLRHTYATFRLSDEVSPYLLAKNMGTSIQMLQDHYGQVVTSLVAKQITKTNFNAASKTEEEKVYPF